MTKTCTIQMDFFYILSYIVMKEWKRWELDCFFTKFFIGYLIKRHIAHYIHILQLRHWFYRAAFEQLFAYYVCIARNLKINQCSPHIKPGQSICYVNQLTGFYMRGILIVNGLTPLFPAPIIQFFYFSPKFFMPLCNVSNK